MFTIGDEPNLQGIPGNSLTEILGYQKGAGSISANEAILKAQEQYHVFHIHITNASYGTRVAESWKNLLGQNVLGQNVLMCKSDEVDKVIAKAIKDNYEEPVYAETPSDASSSTTTEDNTKISIKIMISIVLGSFMGDEGKGQTVHNICAKNPENSLVIRFSGGHQVAILLNTETLCTHLVTLEVKPC